MKVKSKLAIVALFSCCAIMSMGFANWVITQEGPIKDFADGGISADSVIYSDEYVKANPKEEHDNLVYTETGFINSKLTLHLLVDVNKCNSINAESIIITMRYSSEVAEDKNVFDWFKTYGGYPIVISAKIGNGAPISLNTKTEVSHTELKTTLDYSYFSGMEGEVSLTVTYDFANTTKKDIASYKNYIYDVFEEDIAFTFDFRVGS